MGEWEPGHLHWNFSGEHVLVPFIVLTGFPSFLLAALLIVAICVTERIITSYIDAGYPVELSSSRWRTALRRSLLFWIAVVLRLFYMLIAMTFSIPLILTVATTLALTQFILELRSKPKSGLHSTHDYTAVDIRRDHDHDLNDSFLSLRNGDGGGTSASSTFVALESVSTTPKATITRPRSKSKPDDIFIHPAESNIARADVLAMQLGISKGDTTPERMLQQQRQQPPPSWEVGKGKDLARTLMSQPKPPHNTPASVALGNASAKHLHPHQRTGSFQIGSSSDSEDTDDSDDDDGRRPSEMKKLVR